MDSGDRRKFVRSVVHLIFDKVFLSNFTWTGKSSKGRKTPLQNYTEITKLFYSIVVKTDTKLDYKMFLKVLVNKVLKYAYE